VKYGSNSFATTKKSLGKGTIRSLPPSPALAGISSPSLAPTSIPASQQQAEKTKAIRNPIIHRLALGPAAEDELMKLRTSIATESEFKMAIEKVADLEDGKWKIHPRFLKDLDVWKYDYEDDTERQAAIDNAIRAYDKMRLNPSEPQWQMLLPVAERNKGKCLSKLQAKIATSGNIAPKPKTKPADDSGRDSAGEDTDVFGEKRTKSAKSESMVRSTSQNSATKSKAAKEREAQDKRLSGKTTAKPAPKKAPPKSAAPKKAAAPKKQAKETFKSSQFVNDSDEEDSYTIDTKPTPKIASSSKKTQPVGQNAKKASVKRKSDDMDATDDSVIVASKKPKTTQNSSTSSTSGSSSSHQRISESSQSSHNVASIQRSITKARAKMNTSPQKSSPLASSPPTNASDMEDIDHSTSVSPSTDSTRSLKRKIIGSELGESPKKKRNAATEAEMRSVYDKSQFRHIPSQCLDASARFQVVYGEYHKLYMELQADPTRLAKEHRKLMDMHDMLASMKREIIEAARDKSEDR
jgi:RNA polymerase II elongation factor ELL